MNTSETILQAKKAQTQKLDEHKQLCDYIHDELYIPKNKAYGDSFHKLYQDLGIISAVTQITHKYNRLVTLAKSKDQAIAGDEPIIDTLLDMANYCIMTVLEINKENNLDVEEH